MQANNHRFCQSDW